MRNGNKSPTLLKLHLELVLILPMRNGNFSICSFRSAKTASSYPTYEEWKQTYRHLYPLLVFSSYPTYEEWKPQKTVSVSIPQRVLILPMRNGNSTLRLLNVFRKALVLILPMRNGNAQCSFDIAIISFVLILPMRNGNQSSKLPLLQRFYCSYPTYEEWKLSRLLP